MGMGDHVYPEINFDGCPRAAMKVIANIFGFRHICRPTDFISSGKHAGRDFHGWVAPTADVDETTENDICSHVRLERRMGGIGVRGEPYANRWGTDGMMQCTDCVTRDTVQC